MSNISCCGPPPPGLGSGLPGVGERHDGVLDATLISEMSMSCPPSTRPHSAICAASSSRAASTASATLSRP